MFSMSYFNSVRKEDFMKKYLLVLGAMLVLLVGCTTIKAETKENITVLESIAPDGSKVTYKDGVYHIELSRTGIRLTDTEGWEQYKQHWLESATKITGETPKLLLTYDGDTVLELDGQTIVNFTPIDCGCGL